METNIELTRRVCSDPLGFIKTPNDLKDPANWFNKATTFDDIEHRTRFVPSYYSFMDWFQLYTKAVRNIPNSKYTEYLSGITTSFDNVGGISTADTSSDYGDVKDYIDKKQHRINGREKDCYRIRATTFAHVTIDPNTSIVTLQRYGISKIIFDTISTSNEVSEVVYNKENNWGTQIKDSNDEFSIELSDPPIFSKYSHRLVKLTSFPILPKEQYRGFLPVTI
ncbi:insecticidal delta-endotoxin [Bacillus paranthracis]|uniref:insecticidal delta-endotoxin n=1 Tax=Bacillus paranthracis TaxID=2026186 RepID=UPI001E4DD53E|nr:insecticidal delta-endotoxin [Bacillus paranthracis]MCR6801169.1 hypothetical protein [Bacillus paranthracis]MEC3360457.1 insecticidal delta-endotoxin [Bacillus paranthracis]MED0787151.1 insecticidal delta-endotoxin [Bacillus paranthracis]MED0812869.1 insecticidal delta-endotoxin [Bacillus paranthracis]MED0818969.1 insecticidal delta-endotoxin [Bacillus paranthracis]